MRRPFALLIVLCSGSLAWADAPERSIRPMPRPALAAPVAVAPPVQSFAATPALARTLPPRRPEAGLVDAGRPETGRPDTREAVQPATSPEKPRKGLLALLTPRAKPKGKADISPKGSVCGVPSIKGSTLPRVTSKTKACGIDEPVSVTSVDGVRLSVPATIDCPTAIALKTWVEKALRPAFPKSEVAGLTVVDSYSCRPRNNVVGGKMSEHGNGKAIDIAAVSFTGGKELIVIKDFKALRKAYKAGCGIFGTTLGPGSDGYHEDHMHFDTARHRNGSYCR